MAITARFESDIAVKEVNVHYVVELILESGVVYYSNKALTDTSPTCLAYLSKVPEISAPSVDIKEASTSFSGVTFTLLDKSGSVTAAMSDESYLNKPVNVYLYFDNSGNEFPRDALRMFTGIIDSMETPSNNEYKFSARDIRSEIERSIFDYKTTLNGAINDSTTSIPVNLVSQIETGQTIAYLKVEDEIMTVGSRTGSTFTVTRGALGTTAAAHDDDTEVEEVVQFSSVNPITLALRLLLSRRGDGTASYVGDGLGHKTYDTLQNGVGMDLDPRTSFFISYLDASSQSVPLKCNGDPTATVTGAPSYSSTLGAQLITNANKNISYLAAGNFANTQRGCIKLAVTPNYTGSPANDQSFIAVTGASGDLNRLQISHTSAGNLVYALYDSAGVSVFSISGAWSPTSGTTYELEINWDITNGASRCFLDGVQRGSTSTATGTRTQATEVKFGNALSNFSIRNVVIFKDPQNKAAFTPFDYDVYQTIDVASFETVRDANSFGNYTFTLAGGLDNILQFIEAEILLPTFTRIVVNAEGQLELVSIDQTEITAGMDSITDDDITESPKYKSSMRDVINEVTVKYNHNVVTDNFDGIAYDKDDDSIALFGNSSKNKKVFEFKGMPTSTEATNFITDYLARNSTPIPVLTFSTRLNKRLITPGSDIILSSKNTPNLESGERTFNSIVEVMSVGQSGSLLKYTVAYTRFTGVRSGFISPTSDIISKTSETVFTLQSGHGNLYAPGYQIRLVDVSHGANLGFLANYTTSINANWSIDSMTGTANGVVSVSAGKLVLTNGSTDYVDYDLTFNRRYLKNSGCIRFKVTPNYTGSPAANKSFLTVFKTGSANNLLEIVHTSAGNLTANLNSSTGSSLVAITGAWSPTSGTEYELELNFNISRLSFGTSATRLFVDGTQIGSTATTNGRRTIDLNTIRVGSDRTGANTSNFKIDDLIIFRAVQHTANYTPAAYTLTEEDDYREILSISGDEITIDSAFDVTLSTTNHSIQFANYDTANATERLWMYVADDADGFDSDGSKPYLIRT